MHLQCICRPKIPSVCLEASLNSSHSLLSCYLFMLVSPFHETYNGITVHNCLEMILLVVISGQSGGVVEDDGC